ncbi:MAG: tRNA (adenosine(37)-N6)-threonylcarbamoyltransferase complex transferase subunit TsaD [Candidatus Methylacidiphilales bacterium]|nr:tRNA (adenosine(37)-N6)-threonylcarbamoyltransferase complex transferase subunit TsaD [Candidatus Methylacidiphilales bacterium]
MILGIESSCDETSVALVREAGGRLEICGHLIASQIEAHRPYGGVVPELATRQHLLRLDPMVARLLEESGTALSDLAGIAVTRGPGLASSLLIGLSYAKGLALASGKPWIGINHMEGHLVSPFLTTGNPPAFPHVALIVSGGHTLLVEVRGPGDYRVLGTTRDDAAGEAFDKVAKLLGLAYPGGPEIEKRARGGNPAAVDFPRSMLDSGDLNFSFSGLKTAVRIFRDKNPDFPVDDVCASFQQAVVDVLVAKARRALQQTGGRLLALSGGVSCNSALSGALKKMAEGEGSRFIGPDRTLSTDNAAMIAAAGLLRFRAGQISPWDLDVDPNLRLSVP